MAISRWSANRASSKLHFSPGNVGLYSDPYPEKNCGVPSASNSPALPPRGRRSRSPAKIYERIRSKARNKSTPASPKLSNVARSAQSKQYHTREYNNPEQLKPKERL